MIPDDDLALVLQQGREQAERLTKQLRQQQTQWQADAARIDLQQFSAGQDVLQDALAAALQTLAGLERALQSPDSTSPPTA